MDARGQRRLTGYTDRLKKGWSALITIHTFTHLAGGFVLLRITFGSIIAQLIKQ